MGRFARQRGFTFLLVIVLLASLGAIVVTGMLTALASTARGDDLGRKFGRTQAALVAFVAEVGRLPCPANPATDTGDEVRASPTCTYPQGTLPWKALGLRRDDGYDPWGWKISYRVYTGAAGSLTQDAHPNTDSCAIDAGASMVCCDSTQTQGASTANGTGDGGFCKKNNKTDPNNFLAGKGFNVNDFGTAKTGIAYVLISHGPSGYGGYTAANTQVTSPTNANELANMSAAGTFVAAASSASSVSPIDPAHFDDIIAYATVSDVISKAGRGARTWP
jgi:type II secretory pathway pseudopilin PulG